MSWLTSGLTQSVTGKISQISGQLSGQLKDILADTTEDILDPNDEIKVLNDKVKEQEKHIELMNVECNRWKEEAHESILKYQTLEAQLEQRQDEYRSHLLAKDSEIIEMRNRLSLMEASKIDMTANEYQKSAFMEEFEEIMPQSEFSDYINLQKEIKRLKEDNLHLFNENKQLLSKIRLMDLKTDSNRNAESEVSRNDYDTMVETLNQQIAALKSRLETDKDKHQAEIIAIQDNYKTKLSEKQAEIEMLQDRLHDLGAKNETEVSKTSQIKEKDHKDEEIKELRSQIDRFESELEQANEIIIRLKMKQSANEPSKEASKETRLKRDETVEMDQKIDSLQHKIDLLEYELVHSNNLVKRLKEVVNEEREKKLKSVEQTTKSNNEGWSLNESELHLNQSQTDLKCYDKEEEINNLHHQIDLLQYELCHSNDLVRRLKHKIETDSSSIANLNSPSEHEKFEQLKEENLSLTNKLDELNSALEYERVTHEQQLREANSALDKKEQLVDTLQLELKQQQQSMQQEKLLQFQDQKNEKQEIGKLKSENTELKIKLDEKTCEINLLGEQISDLNENLNQLKVNDAKLFNELKQKTEQFLTEIDTSNTQINQLKMDNERLVEQRKQFEFLIEEKVRENSQLKLDVQTHLQHISAQSKAIQKLQEDLKGIETSRNDQQTTVSKASDSDQNEELALFKEKYNQIYSYLEQKNEESLRYYNEIQRLNVVVSNLNQELINVRTLNENLSEQYENLVKEFQLEQKMVDDLNVHTFELNKTLQSTANALQQQKEELEDSQFKTKTENREKGNEEDESASRLEQEFKYTEVLEEKDELIREKQQIINELNHKLNETIINYKKEINMLNENNLKLKSAEDEGHNRLSKELERLREHLVTMSDNYNKEAIQAEEREQQLRIALSNAQQLIQNQSENQQNSNKEIELRLETLNQTNAELKSERDKLKEKLKQTEEMLSHQVKVSKNLESVLERLQNEKDAQNSIEFAKFQKTIKDQAKQIKSFETEVKTYQDQIKNLKESIEAVNLIEEELGKKDDMINALNVQINTKDALIESLEKRVNEVKKINDTFIEKEIIKNLFIGYVKLTQTNEKKQILRLIATMLNFSQTELEQVDAMNSESKWFTGLLKSTPVRNSNKSPQHQTADSLNKSFTELLIQYVDRESMPRANFTFDINNPNQTDKKTDGAFLDEGSLKASSANSALKYFNTNIANPVVLDLNLVNRNNAANLTSSTETPSGSQQAITNIASPALANSFLEQILKND